MVAALWALAVVTTLGAGGASGGFEGASWTTTCFSTMIGFSTTLVVSYTVGTSISSGTLMILGLDQE